MKHRFFYGLKPSISNYSPKDFSDKDYECSLLFQAKRGAPVVVSCHKRLDIWRVQSGFSAVFFRNQGRGACLLQGAVLRC